MTSIWQDNPLTLEQDGSAHLAGVKLGKLSVHHVTRRGELVLHEAGSHYWQPLSMPWAYAPAEFHVLRIAPLQGPGGDGKVVVQVLEHLASFPVRRVGDAGDVLAEALR